MKEPRERERDDDVADRAEAVREARDDPDLGRLEVEEARRFEAVSSRRHVIAGCTSRRGEERKM